MISWNQQQGLEMKQCDVIRFVSMTSLCSTAAPDCRTSHSKGRYCTRVPSIPVFVVAGSHLITEKVLTCCIDGSYSYCQNCKKTTVLRLL